MAWNNKIDYFEKKMGSKERWNKKVNWGKHKKNLWYASGNTL